MEYRSSNSKIKLIIIEDNIDERRNMLEYFGNSAEFEICSFLCSGSDLKSHIQKFNPDILILDFFSHDVYGNILLSKIQQLIYKRDLKVIVTSSVDSAHAMKKSYSCGASYYMNKPLMLPLLKDVILNLIGSKSNSASEVEIIKIKRMLRDLGIPTNILGYLYIAESIHEMVSNSKSMFLNDVYRKIAKNNSTTIECVEISIRNAVNTAKKAKNAIFIEFFRGNTRISNSVFLNTLKEHYEESKILENYHKL